MDNEQYAELRKPFNQSVISKLPRITCYQCSNSRGRCCDQHRKSKCTDCGSYITNQHIHLDYVGHADTTDRLLSVDPEWNWEPMSFDQSGLPARDHEGGMWIRLTVCGVTRIGYGHPDGKTGGNAIKEVIGDAIRNAAMRFGVALDLWRKDETPAESQQTAPQQKTSREHPPSKSGNRQQANAQQSAAAKQEASQQSTNEPVTVVVSPIRDQLRDELVGAGGDRDKLRALHARVQNILDDQWSSSDAREAAENVRPEVTRAMWNLALDEARGDQAALSTLLAKAEDADRGEIFLNTIQAALDEVTGTGANTETSDRAEPANTGSADQLDYRRIVRVADGDDEALNELEQGAQGNAVALQKLIDALKKDDHSHSDRIRRVRRQWHKLTADDQKAAA